MNEQRTGPPPSLRFLAACCIALITLPLANCGGGSSSSSSNPPATQNPVPHITSISPLTAPAGSRGLTLTVEGSNFISSSVVRWGGSDRTTAYVSSTLLTASILPEDLANTGTVAVTVFNPAPGGGTSVSANFQITSVSPLSLLTTRLPDAQHDKTYNYAIQASGGIPPYSYSVVSGSLPESLTLSEGGTISGTPAAVPGDTTANFEVQIGDFAFHPNTATHLFSILTRAQNLGRNDTCSTATPISNGILRASISPAGDIDVYSFRGTAGNRVTIETYAQRLTIYGDSPSIDIYLDTFLELLDDGCNRITYNDDITPMVDLDSLISSYVLPYTGTYYIRVSDLRGDGRPDFIYELHLSGAD
jgi:hypothetical protein